MLDAMCTFLDGRSDSVILAALDCAKGAYECDTRSDLGGKS